MAPSSPVPAPPAQRARISPHETINATFGGHANGFKIIVTYGRPYTKDPKTGAPRVVWGDLVPWDQPYRLGSDEATVLLTPKDLVIGSTTIPAGAYALYMKPSEKGPSRLVFSTNIAKWGIPVDTTHDFATVDLKKDTLATPVDQLTLWIGKDPAGGGVLKICWETTQYSVHFDFKP